MNQQQYDDILNRAFQLYGDEQTSVDALAMQLDAYTRNCLPDTVFTEADIKQHILPALDPTREL